MNLVQLFKCLSDETRLRCVLLLHHSGELCVCELTSALRLSQPKISRHLAQLRAYGLLLDRRQGLWVYYRVHPNLPRWAVAILQEAQTAMAENSLFLQDRGRLQHRNEISASCAGADTENILNFRAESISAENPV